MTTQQTSGAAAQLATAATARPAPRAFLPGAAAPTTAAAVTEVPFYSTTGEPVHLGLTSGHTAIVDTMEATGGLGTPLHPRFHREAVTRNCLPVGASDFKLPAENALPTREATIIGKLHEMVDGSDEDDFTAAGLPNLNNLTRRCGFKVAKDEMEKAWAKVKAG
jgi:hypothetical protein